MKKLPPKLHEAWTHFADNANWSGLHSLDLDRFAQFTNQARRSHQKAPIDFETLVKTACPAIEPTDLADIVEQLEPLYEFGRVIQSIGVYEAPEPEPSV